MRSLALGALLAVFAAAGLAGAAQAALPAADEHVTISGCIVKGDGGYVLMPAPDQGGAAAMLPPAGTSGSRATPSTIPVLYWLEDDDEVDDHAGQRVEITGEIEDDLDKGEISVEREDDGTVEVEFKREGRTISVKLPRQAVTVGTAGGTIADEEKDYQVAVRKVDVKDVKVLASICQ